jgi:uncharacterized membrane protein
MVEPRSPLLAAGCWMLATIGAEYVFLMLHFFQRGAWPIALYVAMAGGLLAISIYTLKISRPVEERLRVVGGEVEVVRSDRRGKYTRVVLPAFWTRLEIANRSDIECDLWLVFRRQRYPIGLCVSVGERRQLAPQIRAILAQ